MDLEYLKNHLRYPLQSYLRNPSHVAKNILWRWQSGSSEKQHVFVVGAPRSGTTLLQVLIASHSRFCTWEGETQMFTWQNTFAANANTLGLDRSLVEREFGRSIDTSSQDRWKDEMSREEVRQFEGIAGDQLDALGYDLLT